MTSNRPWRMSAGAGQCHCSGNSATGQQPSRESANCLMPLPGSLLTGKRYCTESAELSDAIARKQLIPAHALQMKPGPVPAISDAVKDEAAARVRLLLTKHRSRNDADR
ncbi:hypothetical protein ACY1LM_01330 [Klebsiella pneumoniae]